VTVPESETAPEAENVPLYVSTNGAVLGKDRKSSVVVIVSEPDRCAFAAPAKANRSMTVVAPTILFIGPPSGSSPPTPFSQAP
jgi:hypothetical protein